MIASIIITILVIIGALYFSNKTASQPIEKISLEEREEYANNVSIVDGKQIIEIKAKGGYSPVHSIAKVGIPTILRVDTSGTFDCTSIIRIPKLNISKNLPLSGTTDIDIGIQEIGKFYGTCGMGMYPFDVEFK